MRLVRISFLAVLCVAFLTLLFCQTEEEGLGVARVNVGVFGEDIGFLGAPLLIPLC